jgi:hypothetical protein
MPPHLQDFYSAFSVQIKSIESFHCPAQSLLKGSIFSAHGQLLQPLLEEDAITLECRCTLDRPSASDSKVTREQVVRCSLAITVYGPVELWDDIGSYFQDYDVFLQDPVQCNLDVPYSNPHRLSTQDFGQCPLTSTLGTVGNAGSLGFELVAEHPDFLDILDSSDDLPEAPQPLAVQTQLER